MNLILCELLVSLYGIPVDFLASWQRGWKMGVRLCESTGFILTFLGNYFSCFQSETPFSYLHRHEQYEQPDNPLHLSLDTFKDGGNLKVITTPFTFEFMKKRDTGFFGRKNSPLYF